MSHICTIWTALNAVDSEARCRQNLVYIKALTVLIANQQIASGGRELEHGNRIKERRLYVCQHLVGLHIPYSHHNLIALLCIFLGLLPISIGTTVLLAQGITKKKVPIPYLSPFDVAIPKVLLIIELWHSIHQVSRVTRSLRIHHMQQYILARLRPRQLLLQILDINRCRLLDIDQVAQLIVNLRANIGRLAGNLLGIEIATDDGLVDHAAPLLGLVGLVD